MLLYQRDDDYAVYAYVSNKATATARRIEREIFPKKYFNEAVD